jgi:hypothetical protein
MTVNEDPWIARCPRCGDTSQHTQCPITLGTPPQCAECQENPWKDKDHHTILYYLCMVCKIRYLTPKLEREDTEYIMFD